MTSSGSLKGRSRAIMAERIIVKDDRIVMFVRLSEDAPLYTNQAVADGAVARFPDIARHACVNKVGPTFLSVMHRTSIPHLLEHLIIDLQVQSAIDEGGQRCSNVTYVGVTRWISRLERTARIEVSFQDDLRALRAISEALGFCNQLLSGDDSSS